MYKTNINAITKMYKEIDLVIRDIEKVSEEEHLEIEATIIIDNLSYIRSTIKEWILSIEKEYDEYLNNIIELN